MLIKGCADENLGMSPHRIVGSQVIGSRFPTEIVVRAPTIPQSAKGNAISIKVSQAGNYHFAIANPPFDLHFEFDYIFLNLYESHLQ